MPPARPFVGADTFGEYDDGANDCAGFGLAPANEVGGLGAGENEGDDLQKTI